MKRLFTLLLSSVVFLGAAQTQQPAQRSFGKPGKATTAQARVKQTGNEASVLAPVSVPQAENSIEQIMGRTYYDLQTNSSMPNRMYLWPDGRVSGVWNMSLSTAAGFPDRGTGYNKSNQQREFTSEATARIEAVRTGFPAYDVTASGEEWVVSHTGTPGRIHWAHKGDAETTWEEGNLPTATETTASGHLWPRIAVGGNDGQTIHVIALTTPTGNGGVLINGLNGQLRYWRSTNGGSTWDIQDVAVPGIDTTVWTGVGGDAYNIDANGETVAIMVSGFTNDIVVLKSDNNGTTWNTPRLVNDFPLEKWGIDVAPYTFAQVGAAYDSLVYPDSLALFTSDETGNLLVDALGMVHVAYPSLFIQDLDTTDGQYTWYPTYNLGIVYWNDGMDDNDHSYNHYVGYSPDLDASDTTGLGTFESPDVNIVTDGYSEAFNTQPTLGMDDDGRLYITFTTNHELAREESGEYHKQPFIVRSAPNDYETWNEAPEPVLQATLVSDPIIVSLSEYYFPVMAQRVDNEAHIQVQHDFTFGISLRFNPVQAPEENTIEYVGFPTDLFTVGVNDLQANQVNLAVMPNPVTNGRATLLFDLTATAETRIEIYNVAGALVRAQSAGQLNAGPHQATLNVDGLEGGLYYVRVQSGNRAGVRKMVVVK